MVKLKLGDKSLAVKQWQMFLKNQQCFDDPISGNYDESTQQATMIFQKTNHLSQTGCVDFATYCQAVILGAPPMIETLTRERVS